MNKLFGTGKKKEEAPKKDINAPTLSETSQKMDARGKVIQTKIDDCNQQLNELKKQMAGAKGSKMTQLKQKAMMVLKRRKMYDNQMNTIMQQQFNVDSVAFAQESIQDTISTVAAMKAANEVQKQTMKDFDVDDMEDMYDDMQDMMEEQEQIQEVMGRSYGVGDFDENDLMNELNELDEELAEEQLNEGLGVPSYIPQSMQSDKAKDSSGPEAQKQDALNDMMEL